jgi:hypothetical protein
MRNRTRLNRKGGTVRKGTRGTAGHLVELLQQVLVVAEEDRDFVLHLRGRAALNTCREADRRDRLRSGNSGSEGRKAEEW